jgi:hypothetical protein
MSRASLAAFAFPNGPEWLGGSPAQPLDDETRSAHAGSRLHR